MNKTFGTWLRNKRGEKPLDLYSEYVDTSTLSRLERDQTRVTLPTAVSISRAFGISLQDMLEEWWEESFPGFLQREPDPNLLQTEDLIMWLSALVAPRWEAFDLYADLMNTVQKSDQLGRYVVWEGPKVPFTRRDLVIPLLYEDLILMENEAVFPFVLRVLPDVYRGQGYLWQQEVAGYLQSVHERYLTTDRRGTSLSAGLIGRLEKGNASRIILQDLVTLDRALSLQGTLVALYAWEYEQRQQILSMLRPGVCTQERLLVIAEALTNAHRWSSLLFPGRQPWLETIRTWSLAEMSSSSDMQTSFERENAR